MIAPRIYKDEHDCQEALIALLEMHNCYVRKLHGSMLQPGLPDLLIGTPRGFLFTAENKFWRNLRNPVGDDFTNLLRGPQKVNIVAGMWRRKIYSPIYAFTAAGVVHMHDGVNTYETTIEGLAEYNKGLACNPHVN